MKLTILGCGTSFGVPRIGGDWGACDPGEPRNRRRRVSILVEHEGMRILVDTARTCASSCSTRGWTASTP